MCNAPTSSCLFLLRKEADITSPRIGEVSIVPPRWLEVFFPLGVLTIIKCPE